MTGLLAALGWALLAAWPVAGMAATFPTAIPQGMGLNVHSVKPDADTLDAMKQAGFRILRTDLDWARTQRADGTYDFSRYEPFVEALRERGMRPMFILHRPDADLTGHVTMTDSRSGKTVLRTAPPITEDAVRRYAAWAAAAAGHFRAYTPIWEIWNEPNLKGVWRPRPDAKAYTHMAKLACTAIRGADKKAVVIGPALNGIAADSPAHHDYLETMFKGGLLGCFDAISVHPYRRADPPESMVRDYADLQDMIADYTPRGQTPKPVVSSEFGYSTFRSALTEPMKAAYMVRYTALSMMSGVPVQIWYSWKDSGLDNKNREHHFGMLDYLGTPKPSYTAAVAFAREMKGFRFVRRIEVKDPTVYALLFEREPGRLKIVAWSTVTSGYVKGQIPVEVGYRSEGTARNVLDGYEKTAFSDGVLKMDLWAYPVYVDLERLK